MNAGAGGREISEFFKIAIEENDNNALEEYFEELLNISKKIELA